MSIAQWRSEVGNFLLGREPRQRRAVSTIFAALYFYLVCSGISLQTVSLGLVAPFNSHLLVVCLALSWTTFFALTRSGWSLRFQDASLSLPHALCGIVFNLLAYVTSGTTHGNVLMLVSLSMVLMMLWLQPRQIIAASVAAVALFGVGMAVMPQLDPASYSPRRELAYFGLIVFGLVPMAWVAKSVAQMRLNLSQRRRDLKAALAKVQEMATHDQLTGLINRALMQELLEQERKRSQRNGIPYCVALLDIDFFKIINDAHGHRTGDEVLKHFATEAARHLRQVDILARWGGEEFVVLLPQTRLDEALLGLERVRLMVCNTTLVADMPDLRVTFSAGVAQWAPDEPVERTLQRADHALYAAKDRGRNTVVAAGPVPVNDRSQPFSAAAPQPGGPSSQSA